MNGWLRRTAVVGVVAGIASIGAGTTRAEKPTPQKIADTGNIGAVQNGATAPAAFTTTQAWHVVQIYTYHWNDAKGSTPGRIGLKDLKTGKTIGLFKAHGLPGQGGVPNAYWVANVSIDLPVGRYQYLDSQPSTWAQNDESGHRGMAFLMVVPATELPWPALPSALVSLASVSNGCGGGVASKAARFGDTSTYLNSNNPLGTRYTVNFRDACNLHDAGYSGAKVRDRFLGAVVDFFTWSQAKIDGKFLRDMRTLCDEQIPATAPVARADCKASGGKTSFGAVTRYNLVRKWGSLFFRDRPKLAGTWTPGDDTQPSLIVRQSLRTIRATWTIGAGENVQTGEFRGTVIGRDQDSIVKGTARLKNAAKTRDRPMSITVNPDKQGVILLYGGGLAGTWNRG